jgi:hypothetical protein
MTSATLRGAVFVIAILYWVASLADLITPSMKSLLYHAHRMVGLYVVSSAIAGKLSRRMKSMTLWFSVTSVVELITIILITKLIASILFILINANMFVLFKATTFTAGVAWGVSSLTPLLLLALAPVIQKLSWYYVIAYCALCGGSVFASVVGLSLGLGLVWRNTVVNPLVTSFYSYLV